MEPVLRDLVTRWATFCHRERALSKATDRFEVDRGLLGTFKTLPIRVETLKGQISELGDPGGP